MRSKKSARVKKTRRARARTSAARKSGARTSAVRTSAVRKSAVRASGWRTMGTWTISLVVCFVAAVALIAAPRPVPPAHIATATPDEQTSEFAWQAPEVAQHTREVVQQTRAVAPQTRTTETSTTPATDPGPKALAQESAAVTITGCLERHGETFRLKNTTGTNMPKSRSWKSGFLRKGTPSIAVVDAANDVSLPQHIGQRVSVSGTLEDREMQVRSLRRVAASCA